MLDRSVDNFKISIKNIMLLEIKAELDKLILDMTCVRNLSIILIMAIAILFSLTELQSQNQDTSDNFSGSSLTKITINSF